MQWYIEHYIALKRRGVFLYFCSRFYIHIYIYIYIYILYIYFFFFFFFFLGGGGGLQVRKRGNLSKIVFLLTISDVFGTNVLLPLLGSVHRNVIIKSQRKQSFKVLQNHKLHI